MFVGCSLGVFAAENVFPGAAESSLHVLPLRQVCRGRQVAGEREARPHEGGRSTTATAKLQVSASRVLFGFAQSVRVKLASPQAALLSKFLLEN